ncbi:unnamed protein product [Peronospora farinosa]|uniref:Uncharacterized protein n=1 Tax=Peronospora farinosa TaxID=134698 RepID=A0AAV0U490_9STRA|nr:unnamed protein product [Peronospora farinosa]
MARWLSFIVEYNFELAHVTTLSASIIDLIRSAYAKDDHCIALLHALGSDEFKDSDIKLSARLRASLHRYSIDQGLLYYCTDVADPLRIVVPHDEDLKYRILYEVYDTDWGSFGS